jgi:D-sedoheptulose 7-phosphate isomerase
MNWKYAGVLCNSRSIDRKSLFMADFIEAYIQRHAETAKKVADQLGPQIQQVGQILCDAFAAGKKVLTFGNGGSAADAQHLAEEMIGRFQRQRRALPAISLTSDGTALTCIANDYGFEEIFARQVTALASPGDVVVGLSTSGNSPNVLRALAAGKQKSAITVALLGRGGGKIAGQADHCLIVPHAVTANEVQEMHVMIVHLLCEIVDRWAAGEK